MPQIHWGSPNNLDRQNKAGMIRVGGSQYNDQRRMCLLGISDNIFLGMNTLPRCTGFLVVSGYGMAGSPELPAVQENTTSG